MDGKISDYYTNNTEFGLPIQGNTQSILNSNCNNLENGICFNLRNKTMNTYDILYFNQKNGNMSQNINDYNRMETCKQNTHLSTLLPKYNNDVDNVILAPGKKCGDATIGNDIISPTFYGETTFGINNPNLFNANNTFIGHEIQELGIPNQNGIRALSEGKYSCIELPSGAMNPVLKIENNNNTYTAVPHSTSDNIPLYQSGNWKTLPNNFYSNFLSNTQC
tara:strand:+ start:439 stop:1101 length:663 start_codon:yes stop_codon:yes gene_type:complete